MTVNAITDTKKGEQGLRLLIFILPGHSTEHRNIMSLGLHYSLQLCCERRTSWRTFGPTPCCFIGIFLLDVIQTIHYLTNCRIHLPRYTVHLMRQTHERLRIKYRVELSSYQRFDERRWRIGEQTPVCKGHWWCRSVARCRLLCAASRPCGAPVRRERFFTSLVRQRRLGSGWGDTTQRDATSPCSQLAPYWTDTKQTRFHR